MKGTYRFGDFGGGLDGGSRKYGGGKGTKMAAEEQQYPHIGAFRELCEELFGRKGVAARDAADVVWASCEPHVAAVPCGASNSHLTFVVPAEAIVTAIDAIMFDGAADPSMAALDQIAARFEPNNEVSAVAVFSMSELRSFVNQGGAVAAAPITPVWGATISGKFFPYPVEGSLQLEAVRAAGSSAAVDVYTAAGTFSAKPSAMKQYSARGHRSLFRWEDVHIRAPMAGMEGSIARCFPALDALRGKLL